MHSIISSIKPVSSGETVQIFETIYEAYMPENTLLLREYMLYVIVKNVRHMLRHKLISQNTYVQFGLGDDRR